MEFVNVDSIACKLKADSFYLCFHYFYDEYRHDETYSSMKPCTERHTAQKAEVFKKLLKNKEEILGWAPPDVTYKRKNDMNNFFLAAKYYENELIHTVKADEIENSDKEFFIDFRGPNKDKGKIIVKAKDFTKYKQSIKERGALEDSPDKPTIIQFFIDTTSRFRFYRTFAKTIKYLTELKHNPESEYEVIENTRHHAFAGWTNPNQIGFAYGVSWN
jgi:Protein of unknown function (DUF229)